MRVERLVPADVLSAPLWIKQGRWGVHAPKERGWP